ncbi:MAG: helix-turn-helix transcriptional regulator [Sedimentisphaerales bacterium]|nr:helix-turn-helix transcriptional regulator [Sedimentisphaerales bacterium]
MLNLKIIPIWDIPEWDTQYFTIINIFWEIRMIKTIFSEEHKHIVTQLKKARKEVGLNQEQVAELLNVNQSFVSKIESGQYRIDVVQLQKFAKIYKKSLNFFIK